MHDDMRVERAIMVPTRDGIKLACDVYCSAAAGQIVPGAFPVMLERTPYGKGQTSRSAISRRHPECPKSRQEAVAFHSHCGEALMPCRYIATNTITPEISHGALHQRFFLRSPGHVCYDACAHAHTRTTTGREGHAWTFMPFWIRSSHSSGSASASRIAP
jgi:hypothetical protein